MSDHPGGRFSPDGCWHGTSSVLRLPSVLLVPALQSRRAATTYTCPVCVKQGQGREEEVNSGHGEAKPSESSG